MAFSVTVQPRAGKPSKRFPLTVELASADATVRDLKQQIQHRAKVSSP